MSSLEVSNVEILEQPRDPDLRRLHALWEAKRGDRRMPSRADLDPSEFRNLLPHVLLADLVPPPETYRIRLMGQAIVDFYGLNPTGRAPDLWLDPAAAERFKHLANLIADTKAPAFRAGNVFWIPSKYHKHFESCYLPLSADGVACNMVIGAIKFLA